MRVASCTIRHSSPPRGRVGLLHQKRPPLHTADSRYTRLILQAKSTSTCRDTLRCISMIDRHRCPDVVQPCRLHLLHASRRGMINTSITTSLYPGQVWAAAIAARVLAATKAVYRCFQTWPETCRYSFLILILRNKSFIITFNNHYQLVCQWFEKEGPCQFQSIGNQKTNTNQGEW